MRCGRADTIQKGPKSLNLTTTSLQGTMEKDQFLSPFPQFLQGHGLEIGEGVTMGNWQPFKWEMIGVGILQRRCREAGFRHRRQSTDSADSLSMSIQGCGRCGWEHQSLGRGWYH